MATRTGQLFTWGMGVTDNHMEKLPKGAIGRRVVNDTQGSISNTEVAVEDLSVSPTIVGQGSRLIRVRASLFVRPAIGLGVSAGPVLTGNQQMTLCVRRGSMSGDVVARAQVPTPSDDVATLIAAENTLSISPGEATFLVTLQGYGLTTWTTVTGSGRFGELLVEDLGPSF